MLSFATDFPVRRDRHWDDFVAGITKWILGSPHTHLEESDLAPLQTERQVRVKRGKESVQLLRFESSEQEAVAVSYGTGNGEIRWTTDTVFSRRPSDCWVSIRISSESPQPRTDLPPAKKPVLIRTLLHSIGGGEDGLLRVLSAPHRLRNVDIDIATRLISGEANTRLPIIYVSAGFLGNHLLDVDRLAEQVAGMAHVVVEPNRAFSLRLKLEVDSENVYGGTIGVYWPDGAGRRAFFMGSQFDSPGSIVHAVFEELRTALNNRRALTRCTWATVQESVSRQALSQLKAAGSQELTLYVEEFDKELAAKADQLADAENEVRRLQAEVRRYESLLSSGGRRLLKTGSEQDLYPREIYSIIASVLAEAAKRVPTDSRRQHVLKDLSEANPASDEGDAIRDRLKELLRGSRGIDRKIRRGLEEMGFEISGEGKHHKIAFRGDDRYTFTLPRSGSDHRGGLNSASDIARLLFK